MLNENEILHFSMYLMPFKSLISAVWIGIFYANNSFIREQMPQEYDERIICPFSRKALLSSLHRITIPPFAFRPSIRSALRCAVGTLRCDDATQHSDEACSLDLIIAIRLPSRFKSFMHQRFCSYNCRNHLLEASPSTAQENGFNSRIVSNSC